MAQGASGSPEAAPGAHRTGSGISTLLGGSAASAATRTTAPAAASPAASEAAAAQAAAAIKKHGPPHASAAGHAGAGSTFVDKTLAMVHEAAEKSGGGSAGGTSATGTPTRMAVASGGTGVVESCLEFLPLPQWCTLRVVT